MNLGRLIIVDYGFYVQPDLIFSPVLLIIKSNKCRTREAVENISSTEERESRGRQRRRRSSSSARGGSSSRRSGSTTGRSLEREESSSTSVLGQRSRSLESSQRLGLEALMRNLFLKTSSSDLLLGQRSQEIKTLQEVQEGKVKEALRKNKEEEVRIDKENKERLDKVKRENKRREERMRQENKLRMVAVLQENALLEEKLLAKLQREDEARETAANQNSNGRTAPECPVSEINHYHIFPKISLSQNCIQVCLEEMIPPRKIFQCRNGHLLCGTCRFVQI